MNEYAKQYLEKRKPTPCACAGPDPYYFWIGNKYLFQNKLSPGLEAAFLIGAIFDNLDGYFISTDTTRTYRNKQEAEAALYRSLEKTGETIMKRVIDWMKKYPDDD